MICGERVGLRPIVEEDLPLLREWRNDPLTQPMHYSLFFLSETALSKWFRGLLSDSNRFRFMIERLEDGLTIGIVGLEHIQPRNQEAELAGLIIAPEQRGRGWAVRAVEALMTYGFQDLNLHRIYARIYASNRAALRVAEKAGLKCEGAARDAVFHNWQYEDIVYMSALREEWLHGERAR